MGRIYNIQATRGRDYAFTVRFPYDITGYTFFGEYRETQDQETATGTFAVTPDELTNEVRFHMTNSQTTALETGTYYFETWEVSPASFKRTIVEGKVYVRNGGK